MLLFFSSCHVAYILAKFHISLFSLVLLRSKIPSGKCAKLHTMAASNDRDHLLRSLYYCLFVLHIYGCYSSRTSHSWGIAHSMQRQPRGGNNIPSFLQLNRTDHTFFLWRLHLARSSHPGHSTILLRSESPSGKCAKLHTVAASNNKDHLTRSLYYYLFAPHIYGCFSSCTSCSWWIVHSTQYHQRCCNSTLSTKLCGI